MRGDLSRATQLFQIELRLANWTFFSFLRLNFSHLILILSKIYSVSLLSFPINYSIKGQSIFSRLRGIRNTQDFALIYDQSCVYLSFDLGIFLS